MFIILIFSVFLNLAPVFSAQKHFQCTDLRLDKPGGSMSNVPAPEIDIFGICYGHAAAQLVDAYRNSYIAPWGDRNHDHYTSAFEAALGSKASSFIIQNEIDYGNSCAAVHHLVRRGSCDQKQIQTRFAGSRDLYSVLKNLRRFFNEHQKYIANAKSKVPQLAFFDFGGAAARSKTQIQIRSQQAVGELRQRMNKLGFDKDKIPSDDVLAKLLDQVNPMLFLQGVLTHGCQAKRLPLYRSLRCNDWDRFAVTDGHFLKSIHQRLNQRAPVQPIGIGFCSGVFAYGQSYRGIVTRWNKNMRKNCEPHDALVIGRRSVNGQCQFLVRNTAGKKCGSYSEDWECDRDPVTNNPTGNVWIDAQALSANTFEVFYLE